MNTPQSSPGAGRQRVTRDDLDFDPEELQEKYRLERAKRLRTEGNKQYVYPETKGSASRFLEDPWSTEGERREPVTDNVEVAIIGAGLGGIQVAVALRKAGVASLCIIDKAGDFGGVWYWNRYPGAQCDVESYIYLPLLEEMGYIPKEKYSHAPEIRKHCQAIGKKFNLYEDAYFRTSVKGARWVNADDAWTVTTDQGDNIKARHLIICPGGLQQPKLPGIRGIERFKGRAFHASRWDYEYTGGGENGELTGLVDQRVGVIGTRATALQLVPHLGASAQQLYVFQRTPTSVSERNNRPTDPHWAANLQPGWQRRRQENFVEATSGMHPDEDMVNDGWTHATRRLTFTGEETGEPPTDADITEPWLEDMRVMERIRRRVGSIVKDSAVAESMKPYYRFFCKRPGFHDEYLPTFNRPNVKLVDTQGRGPDEITETSVIVDGGEYEVDCLVFCTGFDTGNGYLHGKGFDIVGRDGQSLQEYWSNGMLTFHGMYSRGYPNCFFMGSTQTSIPLNYSHCLLEQAEHIAYVIGECRARGAVTVETSKQAEEEWVSRIHAGWTPARKEFALQCTPSFFNNEGKPLDPNGHIYNILSVGALGFFGMLREWRGEGNLKGLELMSPTS